MTQEGLRATLLLAEEIGSVQVWQRLQTELLRRYVQLEEQMAMCYPSMQLTPSPQELEEICRSIGMS